MKSRVLAIAASVLTALAFTPMAPPRSVSATMGAIAFAPAQNSTTPKTSFVLAQLSPEAGDGSGNVADDQNASGDSTDSDSSTQSDDQSNGDNAQNGDADNGGGDQTADNADNTDNGDTANADNGDAGDAQSDNGDADQSGDSSAMR